MDISNRIFIFVAGNQTQTLMEIKTRFKERATPLGRIKHNTTIHTPANHLLHYKRKQSTKAVSSFLSAILTYSKDRWHHDFGYDKEYIVETGGYYYDLYVPLHRRAGIIITPYVSVLIQRSYLRKINEYGKAIDILDNSFIPELPVQVLDAVEYERERLYFSKQNRYLDNLILVSHTGRKALLKLSKQIPSLISGAQHSAERMMRLFVQQMNTYHIRVFEHEDSYVFTHYQRTRDMDSVCMRVYKEYNPILENAFKPT